MNPNTLEQDINGTLYHDTLLARCENGHLGQLTNNRKYTVIAMLG